MDKVVELLREYQDLFPTKFLDLKGIKEDLGVMKITLKPDTKLVKKRSYRLNPKYKEKAHLELDKILEAGIIELVEESDWEAYSFVDGFSGYHQIKITPEDRRKTTFVIEWGCFQYMVMPFGLKNAPTILSHVVIASFKEFIHIHLEVYFDD
eukprot:PITA_36421